MFTLPVTRPGTRSAQVRFSSVSWVYSKDPLGFAPGFGSGCGAGSTPGSTPRSSPGFTRGPTPGSAPGSSPGSAPGSASLPTIPHTQHFWRRLQFDSLWEPVVPPYEETSLLLGRALRPNGLRYY